MCERDNLRRGCDGVDDVATKFWGSHYCEFVMVRAREKEREKDGIIDLSLYETFIDPAVYVLLIICTYARVPTRRGPKVTKSQGGVSGSSART